MTETTRDPSKPFVKQIPEFEPPRFAVEMLGETVTLPTTFDRALHEARGIGTAQQYIGRLLDEAIENDPVAAVDAIEHIFPGPDDDYACP